MVKWTKEQWATAWAFVKSNKTTVTAVVVAIASVFGSNADRVGTWVDSVYNAWPESSYTTLEKRVDELEFRIRKLEDTPMVNEAVDKASIFSPQDSEYTTKSGDSIVNNNYVPKPPVSNEGAPEPPVERIRIN